MPNSKTLPVFSVEQFEAAHRLLAAKVSIMHGRKFEEGDWADVYTSAKGLPNRGWSNLNIDVMHGRLGVEQKMLRNPGSACLKELCGKTRMHPSATRSIRIPQIDDANELMRDVLAQYADLIRARRQKVEEIGGGEADMRVGWLIWQDSLREFLYFEYAMEPPNAADYTAEWRESGGGSRKPSRTVWVTHRETGQKRFSITTSAGAKVQPYFDVPLEGDPHLYWFRVQGEELRSGRIRSWLTPATARELERLLGQLTPATLGAAIGSLQVEDRGAKNVESVHGMEPVAVELDLDSYVLLANVCPGVNDEAMFERLLSRLRGDRQRR